MYRRYLRIQRLKRQYPGNQERINYARVAATLMYAGGIGGLLKRIVYSLFFMPRLEKAGNGTNRWLVFYSLKGKGRKDFDDSVNVLRELMPLPHDFCVTHERFSPLSSFRVLWVALQACREVRGLLPVGFGWIGFIFLVAKFKVVHRQFQEDGLLEGISGVITFCDAMPYDNLLVQMARQKEIRTITCQHGQYRRLDAKNISPDAEAYLNFVSEKMLCWGGATVSEFARAGFDESQMIVVGRLNRRDELPACSREYKRFGVLLNGENGKFSNANLIATANQLSERYGFSYFIRPHPANNLKDYLGLVNDRFEGVSNGALSEYVQQADFSLAHMTGVVIDLMKAGHRTYVVDDGMLADVFKLKGLSYADFGDLCTAIESDSENVENRSAICRECYEWFNKEVDQRAVIAAEVI